jgi:hypothetical protein
MNCTSRLLGLMRNRLRNPARPNNVAPMSNTALRTIRLRCAGDPLGRYPLTNYAAALAAPPAATSARLSSILGKQVSTLGSCRRAALRRKRMAECQAEFVNAHVDREKDKSLSICCCRAFVRGWRRQEEHL